MLYYANLIGYFRALWLGMIHILHVMLINCENIENHTKKQLDINYDLLAGLNNALLASITENKTNNILQLIENLPDLPEKLLCREMLKAVKEEYKKDFNLYEEPGLYFYSVQGSYLANNIDKKTPQVSIFTKQIIKGASFSIDQENMVTINEALEWAFVNKWAPSNTGALINPF